MDTMDGVFTLSARSAAESSGLRKLWNDLSLAPDDMQAFPMGLTQQPWVVYPRERLSSSLAALGIDGNQYEVKMK